MHIELDRLNLLLLELRQDYQREEDQAILQRDMDKAFRAIMGKDAIARIANRIGLRMEMEEGVAVHMSARRKA